MRDSKSLSNNQATSATTMIADAEKIFEHGAATAKRDLFQWRAGSHDEPCGTLKATTKPSRRWKMPRAETARPRSRWRAL